MAKKPGFFLSGTVPFGKNPGFLLFPPDECDGKETRLLFDLDIQVSFIYYPLNSQSAKPFAFLKKTRGGDCIMPIIYRRIRAYARQFHILLCVFLTSGCSVFISSATVNMTDNLSYAIINNNDLATVEAGAPAYLLMIDSLLHGDPDNESLLQAASTLYTAYTDVFIKDKERAKRLTGKGLGYALHALCLRRSDACVLRDSNFQEFEKIIGDMKTEDVPSLYALGAAWAAWIQARTQDWNAIAEISRVEAIMERLVELDEYYQDGGAHLYLGALTTFLPPALGGKPDIGRRHFERAIEISGGRNLMIKVMYAREYARLIFDRELHDQLLQEVLKATPDVPGYVLSNTLARQQAEELLDSAEDYF